MTIFIVYYLKIAVGHIEILIKMSINCSTLEDKWAFSIIVHSFIFLLLMSLAVKSHIQMLIIH